MKQVVKITKQELEIYYSPLVYIFIKKDFRSPNNEGIILYVGKSKNGINRPFDPYHNYAKEAKKEANELHLYICDDEQEAIKLEIELIRKYKPKYNKVDEVNTEKKLRLEQERITQDRESKESADQLIKRFLY